MTGPPPEGGAVLDPQHLAELVEGSAIDPQVVTERGYRTIRGKNDPALTEAGFALNQRRGYGWAVPVYPVLGGDKLWVFKPGSPRRNGRGSPIKYEWPVGKPPVLDCHPRMRPHLGDPARRLWVTEGIKKGDALVSRGEVAIPMLGVWNWRGTNKAGGKTLLPDFDGIAWNGRTVYLMPDSDYATNPDVGQAFQRLAAVLERKGARVYLVRLPAGPDGAKQGVDDFLAAGSAVDDLLALAEAEEGRPADGEGGHKSQADLLVEVVARGGVELFHDAQDDAYATLRVGEHRETWPLRSGGFRGWLRREFYRQHQKTPNAQAVADAVAALEGLAQFDGTEHPVYVRVAEGPDGALYIDLGDAGWEAIRITPEGWSIVADPPVRFRRSPTTAALPRPVRGGSVEGLRPFLNVLTDADFRLVVGWLVGALGPTGPYPVLALLGEHGSAKSFTARLLVALVDPASNPLRGYPREGREVYIGARHRHVLAFDNLGSLPGWLSDLFCGLATGTSGPLRRLYTDDEEVPFTAMRPLIITSIDDVMGRGDLLSRAIIINPPPIPEEKRHSEKRLWPEFEAAAPAAFGALLDALSAALRNLGRVRLDGLPRMADFAEWVAAAEEALPWEAGGFMAAYRGNIEDANALGLEASPIAGHLRELVAQWGAAGWQGTATDLLATLSARLPQDKPGPRGWPGSPKALSNALRRIAPNLRGVGIDVGFRREAERRLIAIKGVPKTSSPPSLPSSSVTTDTKTSDDAPPSGEPLRHPSSSETSPPRYAGDDGDDGDGNLPSPSGEDVAANTGYTGGVEEEAIEWTA